MGPKRKLFVPGRPNRDSFARLVGSLPNDGPLLGLTHVTTGYILREVLDTGSLAALQPCDVLNEPVIYAFYGRAAFRRQDGSVPSDLVFLFPAVLVLDPQAVPDPKYVFAFDSGAFVNGYMDAYLDPYMPLFDFQLPPNVRSAAQLCNYFFGSPADYLRNKPLNDCQIPVSNYEGLSFAKIVVAGGRGANQLDDRVSTPELVFSEPIELASAVKAAILPDILAEDPEIRARMASLGTRVDGYEWSGVARPSEYHMLIRAMVRGIYKDLGWL